MSQISHKFLMNLRVTSKLKLHRSQIDEG